MSFYVPEVTGSAWHRPVQKWYFPNGIGCVLVSVLIEQSSNLNGQNDIENCEKKKYSHGLNIMFILYVVSVNILIFFYYGLF